MRRDEKRYIITVLTLKNYTLTFTVNEYKIDNGLIFFTDKKTNTSKIFPAERCQIEEVPNDNF